MAQDVNLYDGHYAQLASDLQVAVRRETYDEDLGQASWITAAEARRWFDLLQLHPDARALEIACGSGGIACAMARQTGASCVGVDVNPHGIQAATETAGRKNVASLASFQVVDAGSRLPFADAAFDAVFCNDAINHLPGRAAVLRDWHRVLRAGGRVLFTDPIVVTGQLSNEEIRARSSIGFFLFTPPGVNEQLLQGAGFRVLDVQDVTEAVVSVSRRWRDARARRRDQLTAVEGLDAYEGLQRFLDVVHLLSSERRLSRYMYLGERAS
jgi:SAM-dependent methyltransferase